MLRLEQVATPSTAAALAPESVPPAGFIPIPSVTVPAKAVAVLPCASRAVTCTAGEMVAPAAALLGCTVKPSVTAAPALSAMALEVAGLSPVAPKLSVYVPAAPLIAKPLKLAAPLEPVVAVAFDRVAPAGPLAIVAVTTSPLWLTGDPNSAGKCKTGCWVNATPLDALLDGSVLRASLVAVPAPSVIPLDVTAVSPVAAKLSV